MWVLAGAVNARFLAVRHGLRFEITLHTTASWDAFTTHSEYMRRRFDTVIKTDVLYGADEDKIQKAKDDMRREEMWRDRWARIQVPDRALSKYPGAQTLPACVLPVHLTDSRVVLPA